MKKIASLLLLLLLCVTPFRAEVITLRSGKVLRGAIILRNDEVLILRDQNGARFQYPAAEIVSVEDEATEAEAPAEAKPVVEKKASQSRVALRLTLNGGGAIVPGYNTGGGVGADLWIGSRRIGDKRVFLGGGVGVQTALLSDRNGIYIPLQVVMSMPLTDGKHAPEIGLGIGYGFTTHHTKGGLAAHLALSWRYQFAEKTALLLGARAAFQADEFTVTETLDDVAYSGSLGRSIVHVGLNLGIEF